MVLVGPALHQDTAVPHSSRFTRAPRRGKAHAALLPALSMSFITEGAWWGFPRACSAVGWFLFVCLCLSLVCRLQGSLRSGCIQGIVPAPAPKSHPTTQFWPIMLALVLAERTLLLKALEAVNMPVWLYWTVYIRQESRQWWAAARMETQWGWGWKRKFIPY